MNEQFVKIEEAAKILGVPIGILEKAEKEGRLRFTKGSYRLVERDHFYMAPILPLAQIAKRFGISEKTLLKAAKIDAIETHQNTRRTAAGDEPYGPRYASLALVFFWLASQMFAVGSDSHAE